MDKHEFNGSDATYMQVNILHDQNKREEHGHNRINIIVK
jgi:hypothetical protein